MANGVRIRLVLYYLVATWALLLCLRKYGYAYFHQYALGMLVYQLLTGLLPFQGSIEQLRDAHLHSWPTPPSTINPTLSRDLDVVVGRAMAKKPGGRYPTVSAFANAFTQAIQPVPEPVAPAPVYLAAPPTLPLPLSLHQHSNYLRA